MLLTFFAFGLAIPALLGASTPDISLIDCFGEADLCLNVDFEDSSDIAELHQQGSTCTFAGNFNNGNNARVFVSSTSCPIDKDSTLDVSFVDYRSPNQHFFKVSQGYTKVAQMHLGGFNEVGASRPPISERQGLARSDVMTRHHINHPPQGYDLHMKVFYDNDFLEEFPDDFEDRIYGVYGHTQTFFDFTTLNVNFKLIVDSIEHYDNVTEASDADLRALFPVIKADPDSPNLYTFFTFKNNTYGTTGYAWIGTVCNGDTWKEWRSSVNEYFQDDFTTAEIFAHEIGHNLNMEHDFGGSKPDDIPRSCVTTGETCTDIGSVMDYWQDEFTVWSCCSNADFDAYVQEFEDNNWTWCMEPSEVATTTLSPTTTTTTAPPCEDKKKPKKCKKLKKKGKCGKKKVWKKCQKTCDKCPTKNDY